MDTIPEWLSQLPESLQDASELKTVPDIETLAKNYVTKDKLINSSVRLPKEGDEDSQEKFSTRMKDLGYSPTQTVPEAYELDAIGDADWQKDWTTSRKEYYKSLGLTQNQAKKAMAADSEQINSIQDDKATTRTALESEYGESLPALMDGARKAIADMDLEAIDASPHGASLKWTKAMIELGKQYKEDDKVAAGEAPTGETLDAIKQELLELDVEMSKLMREGRMTEGSPEANLFNLKRQKLVSKKHGLKEGQTLANEFLKSATV